MKIQTLKTTMKAFQTIKLLAPALALGIAQSHAGAPTPADTEPVAAEPASNWITFMIGGAFVSGDDANMQARTRTNDFYGGFSDLHYGMQVDDKTSLEVEGRALPGLEDYEIDLLLSKEGLGYVNLGFSQFRTWYDASGGYSSVAGNRWVVPFNDERYIDRGELFLEAGLRMEDIPEITFRYTHSYRDGEKDSTAWGDNPTAPRFKMTPALWYIDEQVDLFELDIAHSLSITDIEVGLVYQHVDLDNTRYTERGGTTPPGAATPGIIQTWLTEKSESDLFAGHVSTVTRFNDKAWLSWAAAYTTLDSDIDGGSRSWGAYWPIPIPAAPARRDYAYDSMNGGSNVDQFITNLNFMWIPIEDLSVTPSFRYEYESAYSVSRFRAFNSNQTWQGNQIISSDTDMDALNAALDVRYKGIENLVLYANADWGWEDESILRTDEVLPGEFLDSDVNIDEQAYKLGMNWYPLNKLSFGVQGFYGLREQEFDHVAGSQNKLVNSANGGANGFRPIMAEHNTETENVNLRMTWRPLGNVSMVTRYDYSKTEYENRGLLLSPPAQSPPITGTLFNLIESGEVESHVVSETVTWNPTARMYVQGSVSWVSSETSTPTNALNPDMDNDYVVCGLNGGYALDDRTDITAGYNFYTQRNYGMAAASMGYGLETSEHVFSVGMNRMLTDNVLWTVSYGFITSDTKDTDQSGGFNDFDAHMVSTGLQVRF
jgi:hypothetical protein